MKTVKKKKKDKEVHIAANETTYLENRFRIELRSKTHSNPCKGNLQSKLTII